MRIRLGERPLRRPFDERPIFAAMFAAMFVLARCFPFHRNPFMCSFKQISGYPCFTCGMTRSWIDQVHGRFVEGWLQSPLGSVLFFMALSFTAWTFVRLAFRLPSLDGSFRRWEGGAIWAMAAAAVMGNWVYTILTGVA